MQEFKFVDEIRSICVNSKSIIIMFANAGKVKYNFNILNIKILLEKIMLKIYNFTYMCNGLERWLIDKLLKKYCIKFNCMQIAERFLKLYSRLIKFSKKKFVIRYEVNGVYPYFCKFIKRNKSLYHVYSFDKKEAKSVDPFSFVYIKEILNSDCRLIKL